jgi:ATP/ADP translocase
MPRDDQIPLANPVDQSGQQRQATWCDKMLLKELDPTVRSAYFWFAGALLLLLGSQNMIQPPTTSTFINSVAYEKIPVAQTWLPLVYLFVLFLYNFLFNAFKGRPMVLVTIMCLLYSAIYWVVAVNCLLVYDWKGHKEGVMGKPQAWFFWFASNTKSVLFPVMFWSMMNDISTRRTATGVSFSRIAYGTLVFGGQLGGIVGSTVAGNNEYLGGTPMLIIAQATALLLVPIFMWQGFKRAIPSSASVAIADRDVGFAVPEPTGGAMEGCRNCGKQLWLLVEGLWMIITHPVLLGIFWIAAAHLIPRVILDFQGTGVVQWKWPAHHGDHSEVAQQNKQRQTAFFAYCNLANNLGTMALSVLGLRTIVDKGGLVVGLLACPIIAIASILIVCFQGTEQNMTRFWTVQIVLVFVNVVQYALNGPCREMLYVRCTKDVKYKAKSWADMYGNIMQKTIAAQINLNVNDPDFQPVWSGAYCSVWVAVWVVIAVALGAYHTILEKQDLTIGKDGIGKWPCLKDPEARDALAASQGGMSLQREGQPQSFRLQ